MKTKKYWKLKYYLGRGKYFRHWQIKEDNKEELYFHPETYSLILYNCVLTNIISIATKTYNGANRQPCAWVKCNSWRELNPITISKEYQQIYYNPKVYVYWQDAQKNNIDNQEFDSIITFGSQIFASKNAVEYQQISLF